MRLCVCVPVAQFSPAQVYVGYIMPRYRMRKWENTHMESMFQHKVFYFLLSLCDALAIRGQMPERSKRYLLTIFLSNYINLLINFSFFTYCAAYSFFFVEYDFCFVWISILLKDCDCCWDGRPHFSSAPRIVRECALALSIVIRMYCVRALSIVEQWGTSADEKWNSTC